MWCFEQLIWLLVIMGSRGLLGYGLQAWRVNIAPGGFGDMDSRGIPFHMADRTGLYQPVTATYDRTSWTLPWITSNSQTSS